MEFGFLFWLFGIGIVVATIQDLNRREVDNWLNLFLLFSSLVFVIFGAVFMKDFGVIVQMGILLLVMGVVMNLFYYGRVFAGGDAKLLFAMSAFFLGVSFTQSMINLGTFLLFLMVSGSIYGLIYSGILWYLNRNEVNVEMKKLALKNKWLVLVFLSSFVLMLFGFLNFVFLLAGLCLFVFPFLFIFAKGLENVSMVREVSGLELREGDWLVDDVKVLGKVIEANWDGLSVEEIKLLRKKKKVLIKEGLPFVPAFLLAFFGYVFFRGWFLGLFGI